jgi:hypothetical protein
MATENKTTPPATPPKGPSLSDTQARDNFIAVALGEVIRWQLAEGRVNHDQAGVLAVRYANSAMVIRTAETAPLKVVVAKGALAAPVELPPPMPPDDGKVAEPPKSIAEIIGDAEPLAEVK